MNKKFMYQVGNNKKMNYFVWTKVGVSVFEFLMLKTTVKISACFTYLFIFLLPNSQ